MKKVKRDFPDHVWMVCLKISYRMFYSLWGWSWVLKGSTGGWPSDNSHTSLASNLFFFFLLLLLLFLNSYSCQFFFPFPLSPPYFTCLYTEMFRFSYFCYNITLSGSLILSCLQDRFFFFFFLPPTETIVHTKIDRNMSVRKKF